MRINRRNILGAFTTTWALDTAWAAMADMADMPSATSKRKTGLLPTTAWPTGAAWADLQKLENHSTRAGVFQATLIAEPCALPLITGRPATGLWLYNQMLPGPLIEAAEGDRLEIEFVNRLPQATTVHWHGVPVPPSEDGSPWDLVAPGGRRTYQFALPPGSAGTYWFHPHPHAHAADQAARGLAGCLVVRAKDDPLANIPERHLVFSDLKLDENAAIADSDASDWMDGREGQFVLVNGRRQPSLVFDAAGRERWRVWNAHNSRYLLLGIPGTGLTLVGTDGGLIDVPQPKLKSFLLAPGQRAELVVDAGTRRDAAWLMAAPYARGKMASPESAAVPLARIDFASVRAPVNANPPLPSPLRKIPVLGPVQATKRIVFSEAMQMNNGVHSMQFLVNGRSFDSHRVDLHSKVNAVELWEIDNQSDMDHPFHLHGTQFQLIDRLYQGKVEKLPYMAWQDTVNLRSGEKLRIRTVQRWRGLRMFHCHILEHEDAGMMGLLQVD